jgi:rod shape determining protein RodA
VAQAVLGRRQRSGIAVLQRLDGVLVASTLLLAVVGAVAVYSATRAPLVQAGHNPHYYLERQVLFDLLGLGVMYAVFALGYRRVLRYGLILYVLLVISLVGVMVVGHSSNGSERWFQLGPFSLQPSSFGSTSLGVLAASVLLRSDEQIRLRQVVLVVGLAAVSLVLVLRQPDLGSALLMLAVLTAVLLVAGVRGRHLLAVGAAGLVGVVILVHLGFVHSYQISRVTSFLHQNNSHLSGSTTYQVTQAKAAISDGGVRGQGLFHGKLVNLNYLPEQDTDFVFAAMGEQLGFVGSAALLGLFAVICWRLWRLAVLASDRAGRLCCVAVLALFAYSIFQNVGMNMGIMPIAGIPLPLVSYGGSAVVNAFAAVGLVLSVGAERAR